MLRIPARDSLCRTGNALATAILQVEDGDAHPPEDRDPHVPLDLVVGKAEDMVVRPVPVEGGEREHFDAPSLLQSHCEVLHRHFGYHRYATLAPGTRQAPSGPLSAARGAAQREHAVLHGAHGAHGSRVVGRAPQRQFASHFPVCWPGRHTVPWSHLALDGSALALPLHICLGRAQVRVAVLDDRGETRAYAFALPVRAVRCFGDRGQQHGARAG